MVMQSITVYSIGNTQQSLILARFWCSKQILAIQYVRELVEQLVAAQYFTACTGLIMEYIPPKRYCVYGISKQIEEKIF